MLIYSNKIRYNYLETSSIGNIFFQKERLQKNVRLEREGDN